MLAIVAAENAAGDGGQLVTVLPAEFDRLVGAVRVDQQPRQARVQRQRVNALIRAQQTKQLDRRLDPLLRRPLEPLERFWVAAPREDVEHRPGQVDAAHLGLAVRAEDVALVPQPRRAPRRGASRPPGPLLRRVEGDAFEHEVIDRRLRIEAHDFVPARVDDLGHAVDCE